VGEPYEIQAELDEGFTVVPPGDNGALSIEPWEGVRVAYRPLGSRGVWRHFLLSYDRPPTLAELQRICAEHEAQSGR
jgi:hypothetical protein